MTIADAHFVIGSTHLVCQDYAHSEVRHGVLSLDKPWTDPYEENTHKYSIAVASDGCSASPDTDIGARLLARNAPWIKPFDAYQAACSAYHQLNHAGVNPNALDATLLLIQETPQGDADVIVCGDGVVAAQRWNGEYEYWVLSFNGNAPEYPSYLLDPERHQSYKNSGYGILTVSGHFTSTEAVDVPLEEGVHFHKVFPKAIYSTVLAMTDGAESFEQKDQGRLYPVDVKDVIQQMLDIKVRSQGFLKRRMGRFLGKFCADKGWQHYDDFAVAGMILDSQVEGA